VSEPLYQKCPSCDRGVITTDNLVRPCLRCHRDGYIPVGVTLGQVDRWGTWERWLAGDPSLPAEDAKKAEVYIMDRLTRGGFQILKLIEAAVRRRTEKGGVR
jgi:hypothetical protein